MNPYQPGEDNQDPYMVGYKAGAASRNAEVVSLTNQRDYEYVRAENAKQERDELKAELYAISVALNDPRTDLTLTMVEVIKEQKKERDQLREQVKTLRDALSFIAVDDCGCGVPCDCYSWSVMSDKAKEALAATEPK